MQEKYDLILVGGGTAGLALLFRLAQKGYRVALLDHREGMTPIIRPEIVQPRLLDILKDWGLLSDLMTYPHQRCATFNFYKTTGLRLCQVDYGILNHPFPYALITLPYILQEVLHKRLDSYPTAHFYWKAQVIDLIRSGPRIVGCVARVDGKPVEFLAPMVVGADGPASRVRQFLGIAHQLHRYKNPFLSFPLNRWSSTAVEYFMGLKTILGLFPVSPQEGCALYLAPASFTKPSGDVGLSAFKASVAQIDPTLSLEALQSWNQISVFTCNRVRANRWVQDGACLIGDAAHATHPHVAQGTTQAFKDILALVPVLNRCFTTGDFSSAHLIAYEEMRRPAVTRLQRLADEYVWLWDTGNPVLAALRDRAFKNVGRDKRLLYKTVASEAGLPAEGLTFLDRLRAVIGF